MTTDTTDDDYSFRLENRMLEKSFHVPFCQARLHLISFFNTHEVIRNTHINQLKREFFPVLIEEINKKTFGLPFDL